jgi:hypothetical protein
LQSTLKFRERLKAGPPQRKAAAFRWAIFQKSVTWAKTGLHKRGSYPYIGGAPGAPRFASGPVLKNLDARFQNGDAGWSSPVARQAHNLKVAGSNPAPATKSNIVCTDYVLSRVSQAGSM